MKKIIVLCSIIFTSCNKCPILPDNSLIYEDAQLGVCLSSKLSKEEYVIENDIQYNELKIVEKCSVTLPPIDFTKKTLIGKYTSGQCKVTIKKSFQFDNPTNTYTYYISVCEKGNCKSLSSNMNWIIVDKLVSGFKLKYKIEK
jgi:hypothetical protein